MATQPLQVPPAPSKCAQRFLERASVRFPAPPDSRRNLRIGRFWRNPTQPLLGFRPSPPWNPLCPYPLRFHTAAWEAVIPITTQVNQWCWAIRQSATEQLCRLIIALCGSSIRLSGSPSPQKHPDIRRRQHLLYVRVIREHRMEQGGALLDTEGVISHLLAVASALHGRITV